jgi:hypothetical protein
MASRLKRRIPIIFGATGAAAGVGATSWVGGTVAAGPEWLIPVATYNLGTFAPGASIPLTGLYDANDGTPYFTYVSGQTITGTAVTMTVDPVDGDITAPTTETTYTAVIDLSDDPAESDWLARSTGPSVVWAHDFRYAAEVSAHLLGNTNAEATAVPFRQAVDGPTGYCLEQVTLGARLAQLYTAGSSTMVLDDVTYWPTTFPFYFEVAKIATLGSKNMFQCTARSGTTLTVTRITAGLGSAYAAAAQNYVAGDIAGQSTSPDWRRTFSALPAGENGLPDNDRAAGGAVPLRSKLSTGTYGVPRDSGLWQYGFYGHAANQSLWGTTASPWVPWVGATTYTARGGAAGTRHNPWDGTEFWLQFKMKVDPRYWALVSYDNPASSS